jgi:hypothetical protein
LGELGVALLSRFSIFHVDAILAGTMSTTVEDAILLHAMTNDLASTMDATWSQHVYRAFETVKYMRSSAIGPHFETLVVCITAYFTDAGMRFASEEV